MTDQWQRVQPVRFAALFGRNMARMIPTAEFLKLAHAHGVETVGVSVAFRIDHRDRVRTFDYALMLPVQWPGAPSQGPRPAALEDVVGIDAACWFEDGYRLPTDDWQVLENCRRFDRSAEPKGKAIHRVIGFFQLLQAIDGMGFGKDITGSNIESILQWAQVTLRAAQDPTFRAEVDAVLGDGPPPQAAPVRPSAPQTGGVDAAQLRYVLYGHVAGVNDPINPNEVYTNPDPDGEPQVYMLVWERVEGANAFIEHHGAQASVFARPVRVADLIGFAADRGIWFAINPDPRGATKTIAEPGRLVIDADSE